jgi:uncharacterized protein (TIGR02118 family)
MALSDGPYRTRRSGIATRTAVSAMHRWVCLASVRSSAKIGSSRSERVGSVEATKGRDMVKAVVLYGPPEDPAAFERYYADTHTALAKAIPGLQRFEAARGIATPDGSAVPYQRIAELTFEDMDALQAGLGSDEGQAAVNDIPNFATGGVTIFFAEID